MSFQVEVHPDEKWAGAAAELVLKSLPRSGSVVLTGGSAAERVFPLLTEAEFPWRSIELYFSDERSVGPGDPNSNFGLVRRVLLDRITPAGVYRMRGEEDPHDSAASYERMVSPAVQRGFDTALLGVGADAHVAALFPGSDALEETGRLCVPVRRPDGLMGITLTPPALLGARRVLLLVSGPAKADAVRRAVSGTETPSECPVRILAEHPDARFVLDEAAAPML